MILNGLSPNRMSSAVDKYIIITFSMVNNTCRCYHRSSRQEVSCEKGVLRNFAKFTGKYLWQSLFLIKVAGLRLIFVML